MPSRTFSGGVKGSFPVDGDYCRYAYPNWAAKFLADSLMLETDVRLSNGNRSQSRSWTANRSQTMWPLSKLPRKHKIALRAKAHKVRRRFVKHFLSYDSSEFIDCLRSVGVSIR